MKEKLEQLAYELLDHDHGMPEDAYWTLRKLMNEHGATFPWDCVDTVDGLCYLNLTETR